MTNSQILSIKRAQTVADAKGQPWVAQHDAFVPSHDTVNAQVALLRIQDGSRWIRLLTCKATDF